MIPTIIFTLLSAVFDSGKRFYDHSTRFVVRALVICIISYLMGGNFLINLVQNTSVFYLIFDYALNIFEGRAWNYVGETSVMDRVWHMFGGWTFQLAFKILFFTSAIFYK